MRLAEAYADILAGADIVAAQVLLTFGDTEERRRYLNARATLGTLVELGAVPVINENDTVATAEIKFGDNDRLGARVASMMGADRLVLLSDVDGLYTANPRAMPPRPYSRSHRHHAGDRSHGGRFHFRRRPRRHDLQADRRQDRDGRGLRCDPGQGRTLDHPVAAIRKGARHTIFRASGTPAAARKRWIAGVLQAAKARW